MYCALGLTVHAVDLPLDLPVQASSTRPADLSIAITAPGALGGPATVSDRQPVWPTGRGCEHSPLRIFRSQDGATRVCFDGSAHGVPEWFELHIAADGRDIRIDWSRDLTPLRDLMPYLLGCGLGAAARLQDRLCLHGNGLAHEGYALVVVGDKGSGKSSLSDALLDQGAALVCDDIAAVSAASVGWQLHALAPRLKLCPHYVQARYGRSDALPAMCPGRPFPLDKRIRALDPARFIDGSQPLRVVYALQPRRPDLDLPRIQPLDPMQALLLLAGNLYAPWALPAARRGDELAALQALAAAVRVYAVTLPDSLAKLDHCAAALLEHFESTC